MHPSTYEEGHGHYRACRGAAEILCAQNLPRFYQICFVQVTVAYHVLEASGMVALNQIGMGCK
jgi:hypothetical protein